ncbi:phage baseplate assembly protein V [Campylobacter pinnipediorum subsp. pinnipediorum]|uniref:phage baseplate assembly protein V n=1 Tax=Campylobacter pinnipediorum TaxID=1965231 RepID=UPI000995C520|nr:phage baseplate assembly protein V [Campylobacter pinnipediorum]AQW81285.1 phage baseplate assembly protein V [Campylobacter pinnipediorum subsp. pinnipediorum]
MQFIGSICEISEDKSLVRVDYLGTKTKMIPYVQFANSFKRSFSPPRIGEQVIVHQLRDNGLKYAIGAIFNTKCKEPLGVSQTKEITEYEDGTIISYDTSNSTLEIKSPKLINLACDNLTIKGNIKIIGNITQQGSIKISGEITDSRGNLTTHSHRDTDGGTSLPR